MGAWDENSPLSYLDVWDRYGETGAAQLLDFWRTGRVKPYLASIFLANLFDCLGLWTWQ